MDVKKVRDNPRALEIVFAEKNSTKGMIYECVSMDNQSEIIAKINFLRVSYQSMTNCIEKLGETFVTEEKCSDDRNYASP